MEARFRQRPQRGECAQYYFTYIDQVPDGDVTEILEQQLLESLALLAEVDEGQASLSYAPVKWTLKQVVGHVVDVEWVFTHRALCFARGERQPIPGIEQDDWVAASKVELRSLADLSAELESLRAANVRLFRSFDDEILARTGTASGFEFSVRSMPYIIAGHELHHRKVLIERYLQAR